MDAKINYFRKYCLKSPESNSGTWLKWTLFEQKTSQVENVHLASIKHNVRQFVNIGSVYRNVNRIKIIFDIGKY